MRLYLTLSHFDAISFFLLTILVLLQLNVHLSVWSVCRFPLPPLQHVDDWTIHKLGDRKQSGVFVCSVEEKQLSLTVLSHINYYFT